MLIIGMLVGMAIFFFGCIFGAALAIGARTNAEQNDSYNIDL